MFLLAILLTPDKGAGSAGSAGLLAEWVSVSLHCPGGSSNCWLCRTWAIFFHIFACGTVADLYSGSRNITSTLVLDIESSLKSTFICQENCWGLELVGSTVRDSPKMRLSQRLRFRGRTAEVCQEEVSFLTSYHLFYHLALQSRQGRNQAKSLLREKTICWEWLKEVGELEKVASRIRRDYTVTIKKSPKPKSPSMISTVP